MLTVDIDDHMEPKSIWRYESDDKWQIGYSGDSTFCYDIWGDGKVQLNPQNLGCDDGDKDFGDGCSNVCSVEDGYAWSIDANGKSICQEACGNGEVSSTEECDDGNKFNGDGWDENWTIETD